MDEYHCLNYPSINHSDWIFLFVMRRHSHSEPAPSLPPGQQRRDWATIKTLLPYLWAYKGRVMLALAFLVGAKLANVGVPLVLKHLVDHLTLGPEQARALLVMPVGLLLAYGLLRLSTTLFTELREFVFAKVTQRAVRTIALKVFRHLHALSLRFHLNRQTGGMTRDIERGTRGVSSLVSYTLFSILPTLIEMGLVIGYLMLQYDIWFSRDYRGRAGDVYRLHGGGDRMAHAFPAHHE